MALLKMKPEISQKELSFLLDIRQQSLGELLVKLERNGWIERSHSPTDRRGMDVKLTEEGIKATESQQERKDMFKSLTAEEQMPLNEYLGRVIADLEEEMEKSDPESDSAGDCFRHGRMPHHERHERHPHAHKHPGDCEVEDRRHDEIRGHRHPAHHAGEDWGEYGERPGHSCPRSHGRCGMDESQHDGHEHKDEA
jgi:DNA-binding MarR family transcriptional regulator